MVATTVTAVVLVSPYFEITLMWCINVVVTAGETSLAKVQMMDHGQWSQLLRLRLYHRESYYIHSTIAGGHFIWAKFGWM